MPYPALMHRCLELARLGQGRVGNGGLVGAVLTHGDTILAEGFHAGYGEFHAERALLDVYDRDITHEDVLYVNLEPCCHHGKTPPCTDIIIERGIKAVVYGMQDPDRRVGGQGIQALEEAGVTVIGPCEKALCESLNKGFIQSRTNHRPYLTIKKAIALDGRTAGEKNTQLKITSKEQDDWSHQFLRARHDAILVGVGTIISDNPQLNIRFNKNTKNWLQSGLNGKKVSVNNFINPFRIILDPDLRIPLDSTVLNDDDRGRTIICISPECETDRESDIAELKDAGVRIFSIVLEDGHFDWSSLWDRLLTPEGDYHGMSSILVEGGPKTWATFRDAGVIDEEVTLTGPASA